MEAVTTRGATRQDLPAVLALWQGADVEPTHTDDLGSLSTLITHDPEALILADLNGGIVGSVIAAWDGWRGSIYRLAVTPTQRRRGLAGVLMEAAEQRLQACGAVRSQAIVVESDSQALCFWQASGWTQQQDRVRFVKG